MHSMLHPASGDDSALGRLWHGFLTARGMVALLLLLLHLFLYLVVSAHNGWVVVLCAAYCLSCVTVRLATPAPSPHRLWQSQWLFTISVDVVVYATMQFIQSAGINYTALFALPVLLGSVLGSLTIGAGTAAAVTLFLIVETALPGAAVGTVDRSAQFLQAGLIGAGLMIEAVLASQMATRLLREEHAARASRLVAETQVRVNELVIENLTDGILVIDARGVVRAANPAACRMLARPLAPGNPAMVLPFLLATEAWQPLAEMVAQTLDQQEPVMADVAIEAPGGGRLRVRARTRPTAPGETDGANLCVMFLEDLRALEARIRTEKLAAMGRLSTAVAHEIRNPLAAISQANALLEEDLPDRQHRQLTGMIRHNAERLDQIVEDVLNIARIQRPDAAAPWLALDQAVVNGCTDWATQHGIGERLTVRPGAPAMRAAFNPDHLRRLLVNLLDNALRYAARRSGSIMVSTAAAGPGRVQLSVWSDAPPLEDTVQRHLFEPFFSSESRSTGLGLYICREMCEQHGATIGYRRSAFNGRDGNDFHVVLLGTTDGDHPTPDAGNVTPQFQF